MLLGFYLAIGLHSDTRSVAAAAAAAAAGGGVDEDYK